LKAGSGRRRLTQARHCDRRGSGHSISEIKDVAGMPYSRVGLLVQVRASSQPKEPGTSGQHQQYR
jgi:hypothetical protein